jgi:hypothetical protein
VISVQTILCLRRSSQPRLNHKRLKSLNLISGQPLRPASQFVAACMDILVPMMGWMLLAMLIAMAAIHSGSSGTLG